jgi:hypothetical protein
MPIRTQRIALAAALLIAGLSNSMTTHAAQVTYDLTGYTSVGGSTHAYTGSFTYDNSVAGATVYFSGGQQEGFRTTYTGAVSDLSITLNNGETVSASAGSIWVNNITQAEIGAQVPQGLSLQAWTAGASGTINGLSVFNIYLAFLPMQVGMNWDGLDSYFGGNAETLLKADPLLLPSEIDPTLTGTALPANVLDVFSNGLFLGTNHGNTNTVNTVTSMSLHVAAVPEPETYVLMLAGLGLVGFAARRRASA